MFLRRIVDGKAFLLGRNVRKDGWMGGGRFCVLTGVSTPEMFTCGLFLSVIMYFIDG
jgi:hypothetical protein